MTDVRTHEFFEPMVTKGAGPPVTSKRNRSDGSGENWKKVNWTMTTGGTYTRGLRFCAIVLYSHIDLNVWAGGARATIGTPSRFDGTESKSPGVHPCAGWPRQVGNCSRENFISWRQRGPSWLPSFPGWHHALCHILPSMVPNWYATRLCAWAQHGQPGSIIFSNPAMLNLKSNS